MKHILNKKQGIIVGVICVLLLIGVCVLLIVHSDSKKPQKPKDTDASKIEGLTSDESDAEAQEEPDIVFPYGENETNSDEDELDGTDGSDDNKTDDDESDDGESSGDNHESNDENVSGDDDSGSNDENGSEDDNESNNDDMLNNSGDNSNNWGPVL